MVRFLFVFAWALWSSVGWSDVLLGGSAAVTNPHVAGDKTTGVYSAGAGKLDFAAGGTNVAEITSSGVVFNVPVSGGGVGGSAVGTHACESDGALASASAATNTTALQACLNNAAAVVTLNTCGTYKISSTLLVPSTTHFVRGSKCVVIQESSATPFIMFLNKSYNATPYAVSSIIYATENTVGTLALAAQKATVTFTTFNPLAAGWDVNHAIGLTGDPTNAANGIWRINSVTATGVTFTRGNQHGGTPPPACVNTTGATSCVVGNLNGVYSDIDIALIGGMNDANARGTTTCPNDVLSCTGTYQDHIIGINNCLNCEISNVMLMDAWKYGVVAQNTQGEHFFGIHCETGSDCIHNYGPMWHPVIENVSGTGGDDGVVLQTVDGLGYAPFQLNSWGGDILGGTLRDIHFHDTRTLAIALYPAGGAAATTATVTISNASPAVVTWAAHGLAAETPVVFTTNAPAGLTSGQVYYVSSGASLVAGAFQVSNSIANAVAGVSVGTTAAGASVTATSGNALWAFRGNQYIENVSCDPMYTSAAVPCGAVTIGGGYVPIAGAADSIHIKGIGGALQGNGAGAGVISINTLVVDCDANALVIGDIGWDMMHLNINDATFNNCRYQATNGGNWLSSDSATVVDHFVLNNAYLTHTGGSGYQPSALNIAAGSSFNRIEVNNIVLGPQYNFLNLQNIALGSTPSIFFNGGVGESGYTGLIGYGGSSAMNIHVSNFKSVSPGLAMFNFWGASQISLWVQGLEQNVTGSFANYPSGSMTVYAPDGSIAIDLSKVTRTAGTIAKSTGNGTIAANTLATCDNTATTNSWHQLTNTANQY